VRKKRSFLLLEVLIAISLLAVFAPWLMRLPIRQYKAQIRHLEELEKRRLADWTYSEVREMLFKRLIPWKRLPEYEQPAVKFPLPTIALHLPSLPAKSIKRTFSLRCKKEKDRQGAIFRLYELKIAIEDATYDYLLVLQLA